MLRIPPIPDHWSPHEAMRVFEFLTDVAQAVWDQYEPDLIDICLLESLEPDDYGEPLHDAGHATSGWPPSN